MRLRAVGDDRRAVLDDLPGHVGMVIEPEHDRHAVAEDLAAERHLLALHVVDPFRRAGAVELERQAVDRSGGAQSLADAVLEEAVGLGADPSAGDRPGADDRDGLDGEAQFLDRREMSSDLAETTQGSNIAGPCRMPNAS